MKERPILFSAPMVRAILDGRKTMTRRVIKEFPVSGYRWNGWIIESSNRKENGAATVCPETNDKYCGTGKIAKHCPYGVIGDRLWVRETFLYDDFMHDKTVGVPDLSNGRFSHRIVYRASNPDYPITIGSERWKPSIFMPREFSRITLEITGIRVERLQDISEEDAKKEGVEPEFEVDVSTFMNKKTDFEKLTTYKFGFKHILEKINGPGSWNANPWVWVVEFKKVTP